MDHIRLTAFTQLPLMSSTGEEIRTLNRTGICKSAQMRYCMLHIINLSDFFNIDLIQRRSFIEELRVVYETFDSDMPLGNLHQSDISSFHFFQINA